MSTATTRDMTPEDAAVFEEFRNQVLIVLLKRQAKDGVVMIPVAEVDATGADYVDMTVVNNTFRFELRKKS